MRLDDAVISLLDAGMNGDMEIVVQNINDNAMNTQFHCETLGVDPGKIIIYFDGPQIELAEEDEEDEETEKEAEEIRQSVV